MPYATSEAVELGIMEPREKTFVDASQRQLTWSRRGYAPTRTFKVDVEELIRARFSAGCLSLKCMSSAGTSRHSARREAKMCSCSAESWVSIPWSCFG